MKGVDLSTPLTYGDRFRLRKPSTHWNFDVNHPHVDGASWYYEFIFYSIYFFIGGSIERWEDSFFRKCFEDIFNGNWRDHDPYALEVRLDARTSLYGKPDQSNIFRTFQGWLAMR